MDTMKTCTFLHPVFSPIFQYSFTAVDAKRLAFDFKQSPLHVRHCPSEHGPLFPLLLPWGHRFKLRRYRRPASVVG